MPKKILVVDDEESILVLIRTRLKAAGYDVVTGASGTEALEKVRSEKPDLAILDVMMPPPNGYQVCRAIKDDADLRHIPVAMLTAKATDSDKFWGEESGADAYITKPYNPQELMEIIKRLME